MKQFSLEEYLKNPNRKVVTRDGKNVRIICINAKGNFPIIALVETHNGTETVLRLKENGHFCNDTKDSRDLFFATEKQEGWANIYLCEGEYSLDDVIYSTRTCAEESGKKFEDYLTTIQIEWEE